MSILYLLDSQLRTFVLLVKTDGVDSTSRTNNGRNATDLAAELGGEDMVAIQAALDAASCCPHTVGGPPGCRPQPCLSPASVFIPSGTYKITAALQVSAPVYGETATSSTIFNHGNGTDAFVLGAVGCE